MKYGESKIVVRNCMEKFQIKAMSMIRTERLTIYPASREQMETMIASEQEEELKKAYTGSIRTSFFWGCIMFW